MEVSVLTYNLHLIRLALDLSVFQMGVSNCMIQSGGKEFINFYHFSRYRTIKLIVRALQYLKYDLNLAHNITAQSNVAFLAIFCNHLHVCMYESSDQVGIGRYETRF
jgi:hypothetical protein